MAVKTPENKLDVIFNATTLPPTYAQKYDYQFAPIQTKLDWKDLVICVPSLACLATIIIFAIINSH